MRTSSAPNGRTAEDGFTLVEVMVASAVMMVVIGMAVTLLFSIQRGVERQVDRQQSVDQARLAVEQIDRELRSASSMSELNGGEGLVAFTLSNQDTREVSTGTCVEWRVSGGNLETRIWPSDFAVGSSYPWRIVATDIVNPAGDPIFDVDTGALYEGRLVHVHVLVNANNASGRDVELNTDLAGRNIVVGEVDPCAASQPA
ncbi:MAG: prepilin-type N-terminal cleavage/methylation domain-containing protein [Actinomycetota bacterium]